MSDPFQQIMREWAELTSFATALMAWCQHPTDYDRRYLARRARRLADLIDDSTSFEAFADWLDQHQAQAGGEAR